MIHRKKLKTFNIDAEHKPSILKSIHLRICRNLNIEYVKHNRNTPDNFYCSYVFAAAFAANIILAAYTGSCFFLW